jgi:hypothetical protein
MTDKARPIERIRAEVERVQAKHPSRNTPARGAVCSPCDAETDSTVLWPCPTLLLAQDKLKLAEALDQVLSWLNNDLVRNGPGPSGGFKLRVTLVQEVLESVSR